MSDDDPQQKKPYTEASEKESGLVAAFAWLVKNGPLWARIPAITVTILSAVTPTSVLIWNSLAAHPITEHTVASKDAAASQLDMATNAKLSADEMLAENTLRSPNLSDDDKNKILSLFRKTKHEIEHFNNPKDSAVPWTIFAKDSSKDFFGYKVYPTDKCLVIARIEDGQASSEWLPDPNRPAPVPGPVPTHAEMASPRDDKPLSLLTHQDQDREAFLRVASFISPVQQNKSDSIDLGDSLKPLQDSLHAAPVQGYCLPNGHPGVANEQWGAPINQCQQPMFRRWNDGCAHVQVFDHCQGIWGPVVWQFCAGFHHP